MKGLPRIKEIASEKGISIRRLATETGISENQLHHLVKSGSTNIKTLRAISDVLGVHVGTLFGPVLNPADERSRIKELEKENDLLRALLDEKERTIKILISNKKNR